MVFRPITLTLACALQIATTGDAPQQQQQQDVPQERTFDADRLDQIAAPIALVPDALLAQVFVAATYPLEVVEASRFMQAHPRLAGAPLEEALRGQDWDASVKSLCAFPDVLQRMNDNLPWLRDLGDASLSQRADLMDAVQRMRRRALEAGNLKTTREMVVADSADRIVTIAPATTEIVYVPTYYPVCVYGGWHATVWWYPALFVPPPPGPFFFFGVGVPWGFGMWGRCDWGWHRSTVQVDVVVHDRFVQRTFVDPKPALLTGGAGVVAWRHDPLHRRGVNYRSAADTRRFGPPATQPPPLPPPRRDPFQGARGPAQDGDARERARRSLHDVFEPRGAKGRRGGGD